MNNDTIIYQSTHWKDDAPSDYRGYRNLSVLANNKKVKLAPYDDKYFDLHLELRLELYPSMTLPIVRNEEMREGYRNMILNESKELKVLIFDTTTGMYVGEVIAQPPSEGIIELGWDVLPKFQRRGYATSAVKLFMHVLAKRQDCSSFIAAIEANNTASKALARKLGGKPSGTRMLLVAKSLGEEGRTRFINDHPELLTEEVITEARVFDVEPENLLTHALLFSIPRP